MSSNKSLISKEVVEKLEYFEKNGKSEYQNVSELNLEFCGITDKMLEEIISEWFIKKKLFDKIEAL